MKFEQGQILMGSNDYWEDAYNSDLTFARSMGLDIRRKSKTMSQVHVTHLPHFYKVLEVTDQQVQVVELDVWTDYNGAQEVYYNTPCYLTPSTEHEVGKPMKRKIYGTDGERPYIQVDTYIKAYVWNGQPEVKYNMH